MRNSLFFTGRNRGASFRVVPLVSLAILALNVFGLSGGCARNSPTDAPADQNGTTLAQSTGEEFLIAVLDELDAISNDLAQSGRIWGSKGPPEISGAFPSARRRLQIFAASVDTTFIYGEVTPDGYGAVVTERHQYPKGLLLITVRKTHGKGQGKVVSDTKKYVSFADFRADRAQQSNTTEVYGLSRDTIVTHVLRNGILETYTFRLPVVTRIVNPRDGSVRVTSRFGSSGTVVSEVKDGGGALIQLRKNSGLADGSVVSYTQFADSSWRSVRTIGEADGSVLRDVTSSP